MYNVCTYYICMYMCMYVCVCVYVCMYVHMYMYIIHSYYDYVIFIIFCRKKNERPYQKRWVVFDGEELKYFRNKGEKVNHTRDYTKGYLYDY